MLVGVEKMDKKTKRNKENKKERRDIFNDSGWKQPVTAQNI